MLCAGLLGPSPANAQVLESMHDMGAAADPGERPHLAARRGLQMAALTGLRFPMGDATHESGDTLAARYSAQLPLVLEIGTKLTEHVHVGGYLGMAFGFEGSADGVEKYCDDDDDNLNNDVSCSVYAYRAGIQAQYHLAPSAEYNPWFGYGFGVETFIQKLQDSPRNFEERTQTTGLNVAKLDLGVDYRAKRGVGMGLYSEASVGRFLHSRTEINGNATYVGKLEDPAWHLWLGAGVRLVLFP